MTDLQKDALHKDVTQHAFKLSGRIGLRQYENPEFTGNLTVESVQGGIDITEANLKQLRRLAWILLARDNEDFDRAYELLEGAKL